MYSNYLKIAIRSLLKNKSQSLILIGGLAVGMAACILLLQYVTFELSYDDFHQKKENIYRVVNERFQQGQSVQKGTITYPTIGPAMKEEFPEIINATRIGYSSDFMLTIGDRIELVEPGLWVDHHFLEIFDFNLIATEDETILDETNEIVLTQALADRFYPAVKGNYQALIGENLLVDRYQEPFKIVAICEDVPENSSLQFDLLVSYASCIRYWGEQADNSWQWSDFYHYLELAEGTDPVRLEAKFPAFSERHFRGQEVSGSEEVFTLQPLDHVHLYSAGLEYEIGKISNGRAVWSMLVVAFFLVVVAWINYINLATVRSIERSKEVGIRKVVGASRAQLMWQFLMESLLVNAISLVMAIAIASLVYPWFAINFGISLDAMSFYQGNLADFYLLFFLLGLLIAGVLVSGAYPAWLLSSPHVSGVLKGVFSKNLASTGFRKGLVIFQFTMSIALISLIALVSKQIRFMSSQDLGINIDQIITINSPEMTGFDSTFIDRMNAFKGELESIPGVESAATSSRAPGERMGRIFQIRKTGVDAGEQTYTSNAINTDYSYSETYGLSPLAGRFFRKSDHNIDFNQIDKIVISKATVSMLGYPSSEEAIDQHLRFWEKDWQIVGVVPDFHQRSLHHGIEPIIFVPTYSPGNLLSLKIATTNIEETIALVQARYQQFFPGNTFQYNFLDDSFSRLYLSDIRFGNILSFFTLLTIIIASLGLFGLASYTTLLRTKEIGVRKVLGATSINIIALLNKDFMKLIGIAIVTAVPLSWYFMEKWLEEFAYHIKIDWSIFIVASVLAISIAFITVSFHSIKAALANPVNSLRNE